MKNVKKLLLLSMLGLSLNSFADGEIFFSLTPEQLNQLVAEEEAEEAKRTKAAVDKARLETIMSIPATSSLIPSLPFIISSGSSM